MLRIIITAVLFSALLLLTYAGVLAAFPSWVNFFLFFVPYCLIGYDVILKAVRNIGRGNIFEENFLMTVATLAAFALGLLGEGEYPEALAVMLFYQVGELFQSYAVGRSRASIAELMSLAPEYANRETGDGVEKVDPEDVCPDDIILIRPGEKIPLDGIVLEGESYVDTAALTGESVPRKASAGDTVISGCVNGETVLRVKVTKAYEDSTVARILEMVENASSKKARAENFITRFARYYTPAVTLAAVMIAIFLPLLSDCSWTDGIRRACSFLIVSCPCALVISVPLGFFGGIGAASRIGVLVKGSNYLEAAADMSFAVLDKTGTLTKGEFQVTKICPSPEGGLSEEELLTMAASGESFSTHPVARAICDAYGKAPALSFVTETEEKPGRGIQAVYRGKTLLAGNNKLMEENQIPYVPCRENGTVIHTAYNGIYTGYLIVSDSIKEGAAEAVLELKQAGVQKVIMLTGDRREEAETVAAQLGIDETYAGLLPMDKVSRVESILTVLKNHGGREKLGFVGDGINDAPVLMRADVGFAMGSLGSDAAIEAADIVLMDDDIRKIPAVIRIARKTMGIVRENIAFALAVKALILFFSAFGLTSMWMAVFGDVGVAVLCVLNAMRTY